MNQQDFLQQGEGQNADKLTAWDFFQQAYECQMKGRLDEAVTLYRNSIDAFPTAEAHTFLGWTYSFMGQLHEAIEECQSRMVRETTLYKPFKLIHRRDLPTRTDHAVDLPNYRTHKHTVFGKQEGKCNGCRYPFPFRNFTIDFGNPYNDGQIGAYLIEMNQLDEAIPWLERAAKAKRYESPAFPHMNLGRVYERKGDWMRAIEAYKTAVTLNPDYAPARKTMMRLISSMN